MSSMPVGRDRFRPIASYVHLTHVILMLGTLLAPVVVFVLIPGPPIVVAATMAASALVAAGATVLVASEFVPHRPIVRWFRSTKARVWSAGGVLACAVLVTTLVPDTGHPVTAAAIALAWALRAISGGPFWSGVVRLFVASVGVVAALLAIDAMTGSAGDWTTLLVATLLALGVLGQDSIYALAIELDDLRTREAERAVISERNRFAGDLHDIQGQHLGLITVEAELVSRLIERGDYHAAAKHAERVQAITLEALDEMHRVVHANRDVRLDDEITNALRVLRAAGIEAQRDRTDTEAVLISDEGTDRLLGLTVREAITNVLKHTRATSCAISVREETRANRHGVALAVSDLGPSAPRNPRTAEPASANRAGTGLSTLQERYRRMGGELAFTIDGGGMLVGWLPTQNGETR